MTAGPRALSRPASLALFVVSALAGSTSALQGRLNASLAMQLEAPFAAGTVSFGGGGGVVVLGLIVMSRRSHRAALVDIVQRVLRRREAWWLLTGGLLGSTMVAAQTLAIPVVGVALFTVVAIAGQLQSGLLVDRVGMLAGPRLPACRSRLVGAALALAAVIVVLAPFDGAPWSAALVLLLPMLAGLLRGVQQPINGRLGVLSGSVWVASLVNFVGGFLVLLLLALAIDAPRGISLIPVSAIDPWLLLGGPLGIVFIAAAVVAVPRIGVLTFGVLVVFGQIVGSLVIDAVTGLPPVLADWQLVVGLATLSLAVVVFFVTPRIAR